MTLTESRFENLADEALGRMVDQLDDMEDEAFEAELESGVLSIRFSDGSTYVVNSHRAARQIWMSADSVAWHFDWENGQWTAKKSGDEMWSTLSSRLSAKLGRSIQLK
ncbi:MAG: iron donor protein CyaY [Myxococcota bacterium]